MPQEEIKVGTRVIILLDLFMVGVGAEGTVASVSRVSKHSYQVVLARTEVKRKALLDQAQYYSLDREDFVVIPPKATRAQVKALACIVTGNSVLLYNTTKRNDACH